MHIRWRGGNLFNLIAGAKNRTIGHRHRNTEPAINPANTSHNILIQKLSVAHEPRKTSK